jgi:hypothetical protein
MMDVALHNALELHQLVAPLFLQFVHLKILVPFLPAYLVPDVPIQLLIVLPIQDGIMVVIYVNYKSKPLKTHNVVLLQIKSAQPATGVPHTLVTQQLEIAMPHHYAYLILPTNVKMFNVLVPLVQKPLSLVLQNHALPYNASHLPVHVFTLLLIVTTETIVY